MSRWIPVPVRALWRALVRFDSRKIVPQVAIRNTIGFVCAVILGTVFASPSTGVVAGLGALNVCYSDGVDPYRFRARRMLLATLLVGAAVVLGATSAHSDVAAVCTATIWAFAAGMLVALGTTAADLGVVTLVTLVVFAAKPLPLVDALEAGAVAMGGGLLQTLLSTFLWPIRRYQPERRILAGIYGELATVAKAPPPAAKAPPMSRQISDAQDALAPLARDHSAEAERHVFLLVQAERIRLSVLNAGRLQRRIGRHEGGASAAGALGRILTDASAASQLISQRILSGESAGSMDAAMKQLTAGLVEFQTLTPPEDHSFFAALLRDARHQSVALRSQIRSAAWAGSAASGPGLSNNAERTAAATAGNEPGNEPWRLRFQGHRARLLANLSLESTVFRHALRVAVCLALGDMIGRSIGLQRTYWIPMTIAIVLKPDFTSTFARGLLRVAGTIAGLVLATLLFRFVHVGVATDIALMAVFTLLLRWAGPANYGIFVVAVSALVVLLIAVTGIAPESVIAARALTTALGGALALLAYAVWPTWEKTLTRAALADMLEAYREYTRAVLGAWQGRSPSEIDRVRLKGRRARSNAQASVDRMSGEPGITARQAASLNSILVHSHSLVHAVMAMESRLYRNPRDANPAWMPPFAASVDQALATLSGVLRNSPASGARRSRLDIETPPPGTKGSELLETEADRVRTSLRSLGEELARRDWL
jgi:uncharacterized membrane protein YccC